MSPDIPAAADFMVTHARPLDRRRFELRHGEGDAEAALAALDGYRNADRGYGWGLEPDLRCPESQPGAARHAFEVFEDVAPARAPQAVALCDWLQAVSLPGGGLPFALPMASAAGSGPWWGAADPSEPSLQITSITAAGAHRVAAHDPDVAAHPWLEAATTYCLGAIEAMDGPPSAYVLAFSIHFLDAVYEKRPEAVPMLRRLGESIPADGRIAVQGGTEDEALHPLDVAPYPERPARTLFDEGVIAADLDRLAAQQRPDGGWEVDYLRISPAGSLDWRGYATVEAIDLLAANGRLTPDAG